MTPRNWMLAVSGIVAIAVACASAWWLASNTAAPSTASEQSTESFRGATAAPTSIALTHEQKVALLSEAESAYASGQQLAETDPAAAQSAFAKAASKYQLLADHGAHNSRLYFNLANAELQSGRVPEAIANYLRAESLAPGDAQIAANLAHARSLAGSLPTQPAQPLWFELFRFVGAYRRLLIAIAACAWLVLWTSLIAARFFSKFRWRYVVVPAALLVAVCGGGLAVEASRHDRSPHGVVTGREAIVREAGGVAFAPRFAEPLRAGTEFAVVDRRADWLEIQLSDGRGGWIPSAEAQVVDRGAL